MVARTCVLALLIAGGLTCGAAASERTTLAIRYQEGKTTEIHLDGTAASPRLRGRAKVEAERGAATIDVKFEDMQPASTFGPYHGTYVLWGITPEGQTNILGELVERERAESERVVAERAREEATAAQQQAEQARAAQQAVYEQAAAAMREAQKATAERDQLRQQLERSISAILETTRTARGLIVNLGDVLFDTGQASLRPEAREKLSRLTGVLLAYPGPTPSRSRGTPTPRDPKNSTTASRRRVPGSARLYRRRRHRRRAIRGNARLRNDAARREQRYE